MFKLLKTIMNYKDSTLNNDLNSVHRILKTILKKILMLKKMK